MTDEPIKDLIEELGIHLTQNEHSDVILNNGTGKQFEIKPSEFVEITTVKTPRRVAFVDGGDGLLYESPNFLITINRTYFSIFQGRNRIKPKSKSRIQFYAFVTTNVNIDGEKKKITYKTHLRTHNDKDRYFLPLEADLTSQTESTFILHGSGINTMGRKFAEWQMALRVIENELEADDIIVMDGSLQTSYKNEIKYANKVYDTAMKKGIIVCGLAKTSGLVTESGDPLLARIEEIAESISFGKWYIRVAEEVSADDRGFMLAVKFHEKSPHVFRFEILREQFKNMKDDEINSVMSSLMANSHDMSMIGYPYGAIDADRFAQVRLDEVGMYKGLVQTEMLKKSELRKFQRYNFSLNTHDILNEVTS